MTQRCSFFSAALAIIGGIAGSLALTGILSDAGLAPAWLEKTYAEHTLPSDRFAERAYRQLFTGDTAGALKLFDTAVRRDPSSPYRWCDYAEALLTAGQGKEARKCMLEGLQLGPYIGPVQMRGVNFFYRTGEPSGALRCSATLLAMTDAYDDAVFTVWDRMELPIADILRSGLPGLRSAQAYLRHIMRNEVWFPASKEVWLWTRERGYADDRLADEYAACLLRWQQGKEAAQMWAAYAAAREPGYPASNAVFNGSFERESVGKTFDWRIEGADGASAERDAACSSSGKYSLRLSFDHTRNVEFSHVSQKVAVKPGGWRFEADLRTDKITTDQGIGFRIFDVDAPYRLDVTTQRLTGTHGWTKLSVAFPITTATQTLQLQVVRKPSQKFDNKLGGTVWIDAVRLCPEGR